MGYAFRRILLFIPVVIGTTFLVYFLMFALPGDPVAGLTAGKPANPAFEAYLREEFHLNEPFLVQYWDYITGVFTGDLGETFRGKPVTEIIAERLPVSLKLAGTALIIEIVIGISIGVWAGLRKGKFVDHSSLGTTLVLISIPVFVLAFVLQWVVGIKLGWLPASGISDGWPTSYILPGTVLALVSLAYVVRLTRDCLSETMSAEFVTAAKSWGLPFRTIVAKYGLRNSLLPVLTFLGADLAALIGGAVVVEGIFNVPGIGQQLFKSLGSGEAAVVVGLVTVLVLAYLIVNLVVDLLYSRLDPRIRHD